MPEPIYTDNYEKIDVQGKPEWVNTEVAELTKLPENSIYDKLVNVGKASGEGLEFGQFSGSVEGTLALDAIFKTDLWDQPEDKISNPIITPAHAKLEYDLDVKHNLTMSQAIILSGLKNVQLELASQFTDNWSWDTKLEAAASLAGMAIGASFTPIAQGSGALIGLAAPVVGNIIGQGAVGAKNFIAGMKILQKFSKTIQKNKALARTKQAFNSSNLVSAAEIMARKLRTPAKLATLPVKGASSFAKALAKKPGVRTFARGAAAAGAGNALEELVIYHINQGNGYDYDLAPAVAMGAFAPAMFMGAAKALKGTIDIPVKTSQAFDFNKAIDESFTSGTVMTKKEKARLKMTQEVDNFKKIDAVLNYLENHAVKDDPQVKLEIDHLKALKAAGKSFGEKELNELLFDTFYPITEQGFKVDIKRLMPFLANEKTFKDHLKSLKDQGFISKRGKLNARDLKKTFEVEARDIYDYIQTQKTDMLKKPAPKRNFEIETQPKDINQNVTDKIKEVRLSNNELDKALGDVAEDYNKAIDDYLGCLTGDITDGTS